MYIYIYLLLYICELLFHKGETNHSRLHYSKARIPPPFFPRMERKLHSFEEKFPKARKKKWVRRRTRKLPNTEKNLLLRQSNCINRYFPVFKKVSREKKKRGKNHSYPSLPEPPSTPCPFHQERDFSRNSQTSSPN